MYVNFVSTYVKWFSNYTPIKPVLSLALRISSVFFPSLPFVSSIPFPSISQVSVWRRGEDGWRGECSQSSWSRWYIEKNYTWSSPISLDLAIYIYILITSLLFSFTLFFKRKYLVQSYLFFRDKFFSSNSFFPPYSNLYVLIYFIFLFFFAKGMCYPSVYFSLQCEQSISL